ncbi:hypothetical protein D3Z33_15410 [Senegalia massiliensis]|uniref:Uncharacterized protein n=2 Tax=Senegalia massiliensis TaxID=1720316 RepID=A0A845QZ67_9CLOT|nr:hypothetical protein [Senegalia massiliensis]
MPFFIPSQLVEFEYLGGGERDLEYEKLAKDYQKEIDFAFFVTNFNYTKEDYLDLTPKEKMFIMKAWETKLVSDSTHMRNAVLNAVNNAMRKKNKKFVDLWKKKQKKLDKELARNNLKIVQKLEKDNDKSWVEKIYKANGMKKPQRKEVNNV